MWSSITSYKFTRIMLTFIYTVHESKSWDFVALEMTIDDAFEGIVSNNLNCIKVPD